MDEERYQDYLEDPAFDSVALANTDERKQFLDVCQVTFQAHKMHGEEIYNEIVDVDEWITFVSVLTQMGLLNLNSRFVTDMVRVSEEKWFFRSDGCGNMRNLVFGSLIPSCTVPSDIARFQRLEWLELRNVRNLPLEELSKLWQLRSLGVLGASLSLQESLRNVPENVKLHRLETLKLKGSPSFPLLHRCGAGLKTLIMTFDTQSDIQTFLELMASSELGCANSLSKLTIKCAAQNCLLQGHHLETLFLRVLPKFSNLSDLKLDESLDVTSLKFVADKIRSDGVDQKLVGSSSLKCIELTFQGPQGWRFGKDFNSDPHANQSLLTILKTFRTVIFLSVPGSMQLHPSLQYALIQNKAGRGILDDGSVSSLPPSVWPFLLKRAQQLIQRKKTGGFDNVYPRNMKNSIQTTGVYYLLREGPTLYGRTDLTSNSESDPPPKRQRQPDEEEPQKGEQTEIPWLGTASGA